jgi:hypothetical protein
VRLGCRVGALAWFLCGMRVVMTNRRTHDVDREAGGNMSPRASPLCPDSGGSQKGRLQRGGADTAAVQRTSDGRDAVERRDERLVLYRRGHVHGPGLDVVVQRAVEQEDLRALPRKHRRHSLCVRRRARRVDVHREGTLSGACLSLPVASHACTLASGRRACSGA